MYAFFYELQLKDAGKKINKKKMRNSNKLMWQKTFYLKVLLQTVFKITTKSSLASLTAMVNGAADLPPGIFYSVRNSML